MNPGSANGVAVGAVETAGGIELGDVRCDVEHSGVSVADAASTGTILVAKSALVRTVSFSSVVGSVWGERAL